MGTKVKGGGQWGITWAEVADSIADYEERYSCRVEHIVTCSLPHKDARLRRWLVSTRAISGRAGAYRLEGYAECSVGGVRGAASFPGAFIRGLIDACEDLERRRKDKRYDRDNRPPDRT
jgi:hypothetical protein